MLPEPRQSHCLVLHALRLSAYFSRCRKRIWKYDFGDSIRLGQDRFATRRQCGVAKTCGLWVCGKVWALYPENDCLILPWISPHRDDAEKASGNYFGCLGCSWPDGYGFEVKPATVIELCQPKHAGKILSRDENRIVTSLMPCRVSVYETSDGKVVISRMNSGLVSKLFGGEIATVMADASQETEEILAQTIK